jgi:hypothetical protein
MGADADGFGIVREAFHQGVKLRHDLKKCKQETFFRNARWPESKLRAEKFGRREIVRLPSGFPAINFPP